MLTLGIIFEAHREGIEEEASSSLVLGFIVMMLLDLLLGSCCFGVARALLEATVRRCLLFDVPGVPDSSA